MGFCHGVATSANHEGRRMCGTGMRAGNKRIQALNLMYESVFD
jgi:hypothetical protein